MNSFTSIKRIVFILTLIMICVVTLKAQSTNPNYDEALAKSLNSDDFGMKVYMLVILKSGSNSSADKPTKDSLFAGHMANMNKLVELKKLVVAGPFGDNQNDFRGLFILNAATLAEANEILETDPAIKAKLLKPEIYPWYGSAALTQYLKDSDKIWKKNF